MAVFPATSQYFCLHNAVLLFHDTETETIDWTKCTICIVDALSTPAGTWRNTLACVRCAGTLGMPDREPPGHC